MKLLAFTDTHGSLEAIRHIVNLSKKENPDLIICAGDITNWGANIGRLILELKKTNKTLLIIPGNHETIEQIESLKGKNIISLHKKTYVLNDCIFFAYGKGGFSKKDIEYEKLINQNEHHIKKYSKKVIITHAPPINTRLDIIPGVGHVGSESLRKSIKHLQPNLLICGHLHENFNKIDHIGQTKIINPGPRGKIINL